MTVYNIRVLNVRSNWPADGVTNPASFGKFLFHIYESILSKKV